VIGSKGSYARNSLTGGRRVRTLSLIPIPISAEPCTNGVCPVKIGINEGVAASSLECPGWVRKVSSGLTRTLVECGCCPASIVESLQNMLIV